jgi:hypothetical protein
MTVFVNERLQSLIDFLQKLFFEIDLAATQKRNVYSENEESYIKVTSDMKVICQVKSTKAGITNVLDSW